MTNPELTKIAERYQSDENPQLEALLVAAVRLAIVRWDLQTDEPITDDEAINIAQDVAWACQGEGTCDETPIPEWSDLNASAREKAVEMAQEAIREHSQHVQRFLTEMYQTMVDPVEEFKGNIADLCKVLLEVAKRDRELSDIVHHAAYLYSDFATEKRLREWKAGLADICREAERTEK